MVRRLLAALIGASFALTASAQASAQTTAIVYSPASDRRELHVTAYRSYPAFAFVREVREIELPLARDLYLSIADVPDTVRRETISLRVLEGPPIPVAEQTYGYDLFTPQALMRAAEGEQIVYDHPNAHSGDLGAVKAGVVASGNEGAVVRTADGYTFGIGAERTRFSRVPPGMTTRPTLRWNAGGVSAGKRKIELSYLVSGMSWSADYIATVSRDGTKLGLASWLTFVNGTTVRLEDVQLGVMAGTVHQVGRQFEGEFKTSNAPVQTLSRGPMRESISELHLYKVPHRTSLSPRETKNIQLFSMAAIPLKRRWIESFYLQPEPAGDSERKSPVLQLEFANDKAGHAGVPLPAGTVRVMAPDSRGTSHLVATTSISDTPEGEKVKLNAGRVGDVAYVLKQTAFHAAWFGSRHAEWKLELRNRGRTAGVAQVDLHASGNVQIEVPGAKVTRPSSTIVRIEAPLAPGQTQTFKVEARRAPGAS